MPAVNQIESHPYFANRELHRFNAEHGIITEAWAPLARGTVLGEPSIIEIAHEVGARFALGTSAGRRCLPQGLVTRTPSRKP